MTEPTDPRLTLTSLVEPHLAYEPIKKIARLLVSDQGAGFFRAPFGFNHVKWDGTGGLIEATCTGYRSLLIFIRTCSAIYGLVDTDRMVALYLSMMTARWIDLRTGIGTMLSGRGSVASVAVANACWAGIELTPQDVQALTCWAESRVELGRKHEPPSMEWWVIHQTMDALFSARRN